jgi:hypothetical protein
MLSEINCHKRANTAYEVSVDTFLETGNRMLIPRRWGNESYCLMKREFQLGRRKCS